ncbi:MAG: DUF4861 domain-containing protein [Bacteroidaceae bacterium]|nr:DUF4861 domain-containing protein [Bacteroidaceae bacterium]
MKKATTILWALLCCATAFATTHEIGVIVENPMNIQRRDVPVVIATSDVDAGFDIQSATVYISDTEIPSQVDDLDGDRQADEIAFLIDMPAKGKIEARIVVSDIAAESNRYPARVYADMLVATKSKKRPHAPINTIATPTGDLYNYLHHHGPAFESELVAYRIYFDRKQTVDIYGKFNKGFEVAPSGWYPNDEQLAQGFGDDVLRVSGSCGVGTLKGWNGKKAIHIDPVDNRRATIVAYGPIRTIVDMAVEGWQYGNSKLNMTCRYTLYGGHRDAQVDVLFSRPLGNEVFCTGVQDIKDSQSMSNHQGLVACWGTDWPVNDTIKYAKETVGLATSIPSHLVVGEKKDKINYLYQVSAPGATALRYYITFTSMKETYGYKTAEEWFAHVTAWRKELETPCIVKIK